MRRPALVAHDRFSRAVMRTATCFVLLLLTRPAGLLAQVPASTGDRVVTGTVIDSTSNRPIVRSLVCAADRCVDVDESGHYRLTALPAGQVRFSVTCEVLRGFGALLGQATIELSDPAPITRDWVLSSAGCDKRPLRLIKGTFSGYFSSAFEESEFKPCPADAWFVPGDSLDVYRFDNRRAWVSFPGNRVPSYVQWPRQGVRDQYGSARYFVRFRGSIEGPGQYGHMGVSAFELRVDSILEVRAPGRHDCRR